MIRFGFYKGGKRKCLTFSYDDNRKEERELIRIFNEYGMKGTFHINSSTLDKNSEFITSAELPELYKGHEVAVHGLTHPWLDRLPPEEMVYEVLEDRKRLETLCGYPVKGMSFPFGSYNEDVIKALPALGIKYARTIINTNKFELPESFLRWHPTCHHNNDIINKADLFKKARAMSLFYVWGHSFEFGVRDNWDIIKAFCEKMADDPDVWYATNVEIYDYMTALRSLEFTVDKSLVYNPTALDVWIEKDEEPIEIPAGKTVNL